MRSCFLALCLLFAPISAFAVTVVAVGATQPGDTHGINLVGPRVAISSNNRWYDKSRTDPPSSWVWGGHVRRENSARFEFFFDLSGFDLATVKLAGKWGVDNIGRAYLNGVKIAELVSPRATNYRRLHDYSVTDDTLFLSGINRLSFDLEDRGGPAGFRATAIVTASRPLPEVPLPGTASLMVIGLAALAARRSARQRP